MCCLFESIRNLIYIWTPWVAQLHWPIVIHDFIKYILSRCSLARCCHSREGKSAQILNDYDYYQRSEKSELWERSRVQITSQNHPILDNKRESMNYHNSGQWVCISHGRLARRESNLSRNLPSYVRYSEIGLVCWESILMDGLPVLDTIYHILLLRRVDSCCGEVDSECKIIWLLSIYFINLSIFSHLVFYFFYTLLYSCWGLYLLFFIIYIILFGYCGVFNIFDLRLIPYFFIYLFI